MGAVPGAVVLPGPSRVGELPTPRTNLWKKMWKTWGKMGENIDEEKWGSVPLLPTWGWQSGYAGGGGTNMSKEWGLHITCVQDHRLLMKKKSDLAKKWLLKIKQRSGKLLRWPIMSTHAWTEIFKIYPINKDSPWPFEAKTPLNRISA